MIIKNRREIDSIIDMVDSLKHIDCFDSSLSCYILNNKDFYELNIINFGELTLGAFGDWSLRIPGKLLSDHITPTIRQKYKMKKIWKEIDKRNKK